MHINANTPDHIVQGENLYIQFRECTEKRHGEHYLSKYLFVKSISAQKFRRDYFFRPTSLPEDKLLPLRRV